MKILFIIKKIDFGDYLSICYLSSIAKQLNHETYLCILDSDNVDIKMKTIKPDVLAYSADMIGYIEMVEVNKKLKNKYNFISIMGGPQPTFYPELFKNSSMDAFCIGEGEYAFKEFLEQIEKKESFDNVLNLITKNNKNEIRPLIKDINELPMPDRSLTLNNYYLKNISKKSFFATRGCPYNCSYCCNSYFKKIYKGKGKFVRRFSVDYVIKELEFVKNNYKMDFVKFSDDLFIFSADKWLEEFAEKYSEKINLPFNCYLRLDIVNEKLLKLLKKAGCYSVHLSVDSCSKKIRENVLNRKWKNIEIEKNIKLIHKYGIKTWVNFMSAAPDSTLQDDIDALLLCKKTKISLPNFSTTTPVNGTALYDYCLKKGYIEKDFIGYMNDAVLKSKLNCFSDKEKNIRYNIFCLGPIVSKLPFPFFQIGLQIIKRVPNNKLFLKIHDWFLSYGIKNTIYKLKE